MGTRGYIYGYQRVYIWVPEGIYMGTRGYIYIYIYKGGYIYGYQRVYIYIYKGTRGYIYMYIRVNTCIKLINRSRNIINNFA